MNSSSKEVFFPNSTISEPERLLLISWCSVALLLCLTGNTLILLATLRHKAIKLDTTSVLLIKNIAVCDMAMGLFGVHPVLVTLLYGTWPYGVLGCKIFYYIDGPISYVSTVLFVCSLQLNKIHTIVYPLRTVARSSKLGYSISATVWFLTALNPLTKLTVDSSDVIFRQGAFKCGYAYSASIWDQLFLISGTVFTFIPNIVVAVTTVILVIMVRRVGGRVNCQGIKTALLVGVTYFNGPLFLYLVAHSFVNESHSSHSSPDSNSFLVKNVLPIVSFLIFFNCFSNFFVYYRSVNSFKLFVWNRVLDPIKKLAVQCSASFTGQRS